MNDWVESNFELLFYIVAVNNFLNEKILLLIDLIEEEIQAKISTELL